MVGFDRLGQLKEGYKADFLILTGISWKFLGRDRSGQRGGNVY